MTISDTLFLLVLYPLKLLPTDVLYTQCFNMPYLFGVYTQLVIYYIWNQFRDVLPIGCVAVDITLSTGPGPNHQTFDYKNLSGLHSKIGDLLALHITLCINEYVHSFYIMITLISLWVVLNPIIWLSLYLHLPPILTAVHFYQLAFFKICEIQFHLTSSIYQAMLPSAPRFIVSYHYNF